MLGSHHDAEDVLQEVSLRALRGRAGFEGRSSLRTWLHRIAVNACLNKLDHKERRIMLVDYGPAAGPDDGFDHRLENVLWVEPTPSDPQQRAEYLVSIELASSSRCSSFRQSARGVDHVRRPGVLGGRDRRGDGHDAGLGQLGAAAGTEVSRRCSSRLQPTRSWPTSVMPGSANSWPGRPPRWNTATWTHCSRCSPRTPPARRRRCPTGSGVSPRSRPSWPPARLPRRGDTARLSLDPPQRPIIFCS